MLEGAPRPPLADADPADVGLVLGVRIIVSREEQPIAQE